MESVALDFCEGKARTSLFWLVKLNNDLGIVFEVI